MIPKNIEVAKQNMRVRRCFQKTSASINGSPVCPEKKRSAPVLNRKKFGLFEIACRRTADFPSMTLWSGNGPIWVRVMNPDRMSTNIATLFMANGKVRGLLKHRMPIQMPKTIGPKTNIQSTSNTGTFDRTISDTALDARSNA